MDLERETSSLDDDRPGSQGEIDPGSEGDFGGPPPVDPADAAEGLRIIEEAVATSR